MKAICFSIAVGILPLPALAACQTGPFETFFREFARDIAVQEAVVPERILVSELDPDAAPEPVLIEREVAREELLWPLVPNLTSFERGGGSVSHDPLAEGVSVTLRGDNGYLKTLVFVQTPCWRLVSIKDESL